MTIFIQLSRLGLAGGLVLILAGCSVEAMKIVTEATETASKVFREAKDEARIQRDHEVSGKLGQWSVGSNRFTVEELQTLKTVVAAAKTDGRVTPEEADRILVEMERVAALRPSADQN